MSDDRDKMLALAKELRGPFDKIHICQLRRIADDLDNLAAKPAASPSDDPTASTEWNAGCDFALSQLCTVLGVDPQKVSWDAATETVDGDVRAVIGNILRAKFGEDWDPRVPLPMTVAQAEEINRRST